MRVGRVGQVHRVIWVCSGKIRRQVFHGQVSILLLCEGLILAQTWQGFELVCWSHYCFSSKFRHDEQGVGNICKGNTLYDI